MTEPPLLQVEGVVKHFPVRNSGIWRGGRDAVHAVDNVSFSLHSSETLGLVGETGCGKSTLARCIAGLYPVTSGRVIFDGEDIATFGQSEMRRFRRNVQVIFQDPYGSLNPRRRVGSIIGDPFAIHNVCSGPERRRQVQELMELVGLNPEHFNRFPSEFSGGQRQRIGIARALALKPKLVICDEPVSALDVSIQAQIVNLLVDLQKELNLTYLFIGHDLSVIEHVSHRVAVMYLGKVVELSLADVLFAGPRHPYANALLSATMVPDPDASQRRGTVVLSGDVPSPLRPPTGCRFHPRCPKAEPICSMDEPLLELKTGDTADHVTACHFPLLPGQVLQPTASPLGSGPDVTAATT